MFTRNIKDTFTANLLNAVSGVLGEAKKCKDCGCAKCTCDDAEDQPEETKEGYVSHAQRKAVWANRADDGKGHPDKKKMKKEGYMPTNDMPSEKDRKTAGKLGDLLKRERDAKEKKEPNGVKTEDTDMPWAEDPNNPTRKAGVRKDEYGNKVKNVAKHLAKKAMKANEEVEEIEEKRGLWDNIHAKRKRIKAGSGERMRKPGSEGAPSAADLKASQKEEVSLDDAFEQIDEISADMAHRYLKGKRERDYDISADGTSSKLKKPQSFAKMNKDVKSSMRALRTIEKAKKTNEEVEELDEISKATMGRYINKAKDSIDTASYKQGHKEAHGSSSKPLEKKLTKRHKGIETAVKKLTKEEQDFVDSLNEADYSEKGDAERMRKRQEGQQKTFDAEKAFEKRAAARKNAKEFLKSYKKEETEITEARGRPKKAGARDFTIHPKTKEKLMHNNPEHMKRIERLQKTGILQKPKTEANQHVIQQLQRAKLSMRGGETVNFTHGDPTHVSGTHASKLLDKYAGMKPNEKEAFQKKIGHSHENLKSEL
jgi:uncharacterized protein YciI